MIKELKFLNLLYVEDNIKVRDNYAKTFSLLFNKVYTAINYEESLYLYNRNKIDLILLDIELNEIKNGFDIAFKIREINSEIPIIFLTSHEEISHVQKAINNNMNGYIIKPLDTEKFMDIIMNFFKVNNNINIIKFSNYIYNLATYELHNIEGEKISLGQKEHKLLQILLQNKHQIVNRETLEHTIWDHPVTSDSTLKNLIASLRKKIGKDMITNESKLGWRLDI